MFAVTVSRRFVARHFLTVPDPGPEGEPHAHEYEAAVELRGPELNEYDYLVDIDDVERALEGVVDRYREATLNELPEFEGRNPSAERLARAVHERFATRLDAPGVETLTVRVDEDDVATVSYNRPV